MGVIDRVNKYYEDARKRSERRKSLLNLLLIPAVVIPAAALWFACLYGMGALHAHYYPGQGFVSQPEGIGPVLAAVAPLFAAFPLGMVVGNWIAFKVPFLREALNKEAKDHPNTSYGKAQMQLLKMSCVIVPVSLLIAVGGALLAW